MSNVDENRPPPSWTGRNAGTLIGAVLFALLGLVIVAQVGC